MRWIADATTLLRRTELNETLPAINRDRLLDFARRRALALRLAAALDSLRTRFNAPIPERVIEAFRAAPVSEAEKKEFRFASRWKGNVPGT